jgi:ATP-dependent RNA helicase UAP56/SUB2
MNIECDKLLDEIYNRKDVQSIFIKTPCNKQTMMFSATISKDVRDICRKFLRNKLEIIIDNDSNLTLHGLQQ